MKKVVAIFLFILFGNIVSAQNEIPLKFEKTHHDFGKVKEETEKISYTFHYTHKGTEPVSIYDVSTSCGCTAGEWTKESIKPGDKGVITVTYTTAKRPGAFKQPVVVLLGEKNEMSVNLSISGEVIPREKTKYDIYPIPVGNLRFKHTHLAFFKIEAGSSKTDSLFIYNDGDKSMSIKIQNPAPYLSFKFVPEKLLPKEEGIIIITYDASKRADYGLIYDRIILETNDDSLDIKSFHISAELQEDFSNLTLNDLKNAPEMSFEYETFTFDTINEGDVLKHVFNFTNSGSSNLNIRKISTSCGCTATNLSSEITKAGEKGQIVVEFHSKNKRGYQRQTITIITNNPHRPTVKIVLQGYVRPVF